MLTCLCQTLDSRVVSNCRARSVRILFGAWYRFQYFLRLWAEKLKAFWLESICWFFKSFRKLEFYHNLIITDPEKCILVIFFCRFYSEQRSTNFEKESLNCSDTFGIILINEFSPSLVIDSKSDWNIGRILAFASVFWLRFEVRWAISVRVNRRVNYRGLLIVLWI